MHVSPPASRRLRVPLDPDMKDDVVQSNEEWKYWGATDPFYGVLSDPRKRKGGTSPWQEEEFFKVGEEHWASLWPQWKSYGVSTDSCLEIGCGVGRMTRFLAREFNRVHAVDVSEGMIESARSRSPANVTYYLTNGLDLPLPDGSVSAAFSMHVLQHLNSTDLQTEYFRRIYRALKPGGSLLVHIPIYKFPFTGSKLRKLYGLVWLKNRWLNRFRRILLRAGVKVDVMELTEMPVEAVFTRLAAIGFSRVEIRLVPTHANTQIHPLVLATKP